MKMKIIGVIAAALTVMLLGLANTSQAYAAHTRNEAVSWASSQIGKGLDYDGVYGNQCVDLIKYYYAYFGVAGYATGNANAYITNSLPAGWTRVYGNYQPGDIAVWKVNHSCSTCSTSAYGHVGIITSADSVGFNAVNQNFGGRSYCTQNWFYCSALSCAIRPAYGSSDLEKPQITNAKITNVTSDGYTVTCNVSDNVGVTRVSFPSWNTDKHTGNDANWLSGSVSGNTATCRINLSSLKSGVIQGNYMTHIYAYDAAGNQTSISAGSVYIDRTAPKISDVRVVTKDSQGYLLECKVTDSSNISRVQCPTWTIKNGQDELAKNWQENTAVRAYLYSSGVYRFRVNRSEHNNEYGDYLTHIYAYDVYGNACCNTDLGIVTIDSKIVPKKIVRYGDRILSIYDENMTWSDMKSFATERKSQLVSITSQKKQEVVQELLKGRERPYYYIGSWQAGKGASWQWLSGEGMSYTNWASGQPDCANDNEFYGSVITASGKWNDLSSNYNNAGFILETPIGIDTDVIFEEMGEIYSNYVAELETQENQKTDADKVEELETEKEEQVGEEADNEEEADDKEEADDEAEDSCKEEKLEIGKTKLRSMKNQKRRRLKISVRSTKNADYYEYVVSTSSSFHKNKKTIRTSRRTAVFKKLKKRTYYVRVRGYAYENGEKVCGEWSTLKKVKVKK